MPKSFLAVIPPHMVRLSLHQVKTKVFINDPSSRCMSKVKVQIMEVIFWPSPNVPQRSLHRPVAFWRVKSQKSRSRTQKCRIRFSTVTLRHMIIFMPQSYSR